VSLLDSLTPEERAAADQAVARLRAEQDVRAAGGDLGGGGFRIDREQAARDDSAASDEWRDAYSPALDPVEQMLAEQEARESEDFNAFWSSRTRKGKTLRNVHGIDLTLPSSLPLAFEVEARRLQNDRSNEAVHHLFGLLYGKGALAALIANGLDVEGLGVLLMWGAANGNGQDMTLSQATAQFEEMKAKQAAGKALRPSGSGGTSSSIGRSSNPTSHGNTRKKGRKRR